VEDRDHLDQLDERTECAEAEADLEEGDAGVSGGGQAGEDRKSEDVLDLVGRLARSWGGLGRIAITKANKAAAQKA
jgi:hypothetical protein